MSDKQAVSRSTAWLLELTQPSAGVYCWQAVRQITVWPEKKSARGVFSSLGLGGEGWTFRVRPGVLTGLSAVLFDGCHHILTSCTRTSPGAELWEAARVNPRTAVLTRYTTSMGVDGVRRRAAAAASLTFPVILTERYRGASSGVVNAEETQTVVAVTPKVVALELADVLTVDGRQYVVRQIHDWDTWQNEYLIEYRGDV